MGWGAAFAPGQIELKALPLFLLLCHLGGLMAFLESRTRIDKLLPSLLAIA